jgi:hypothetical protein
MIDQDEPSNIDLFSGFTDEQAKTFTKALLNGSLEALADASDIDLLLELRRRGVLVPVSGAAYVPELDHKHFGADKHYRDRRFREAADNIGSYLGATSGNRLTKSRIVPMDRKGVSLTPDDLDEGQHVHKLRYEVKAWIVDQKAIGDASR